MTAMTTYTISPRGESDFEPFAVEARDYGEAGNRAARRLYGEHTYAIRQRGHPEMSGTFQAYRALDRRHGEEIAGAIGGNFHVRARG